MATNEFYTPTGWPSFRATGDSASGRAELTAIKAGFDLLPALAGMGLRVVRVNSGGTALESVTYTTAKIISSDGSVAYTADQPMGGFNFTGLSAGTTAGDSVRYEQVAALAGLQINTTAAKGTPVDADKLLLSDSAASWAAKSFTVANLKAILKTYLDTLYVALTGNQSIAGIKTFSDTTDASSPTAGGTIISGGCAVAKKLFVGTLLDLSAATAGQIKFPATQVPSADPNTLDDYEEGTWTPIIEGSGAPPASGQAYSEQSGWYTKIGNFANTQGAVTLSTLGTLAGEASIGGFPFTQDSAAGSFAGGSIGTFANMTTSMMSLSLLGRAAATFVRVRGIKTGATSTDTLAQGDLSATTRFAFSYGYRTA